MNYIKETEFNKIIESIDTYTSSIEKIIKKNASQDYQCAFHIKQYFFAEEIFVNIFNKQYGREIFDIDKCRKMYLIYSILGSHISSGWITEMENSLSNQLHVSARIEDDSFLDQILENESYQKLQLIKQQLEDKTSTSNLHIIATDRLNELKLTTVDNLLNEIKNESNNMDVIEKEFWIRKDELINLYKQEKKSFKLCQKKIKNYYKKSPGNYKINFEKNETFELLQKKEHVVVVLENQQTLQDIIGDVSYQLLLRLNEKNENIDRENIKQSFRTFLDKSNLAQSLDLFEYIQYVKDKDISDVLDIALQKINFPDRMDNTSQADRVCKLFKNTKEQQYITDKKMLDFICRFKNQTSLAANIISRYLIALISNVEDYCINTDNLFRYVEKETLENIINVFEHADDPMVKNFLQKINENKDVAKYATNIIDNNITIRINNIWCFENNLKRELIYNSFRENFMYASWAISDKSNIENFLLGCNVNDLRKKSIEVSFVLSDDPVFSIIPNEVKLSLIDNLAQNILSHLKLFNTKEKKADEKIFIQNNIKEVNVRALLAIQEYSKNREMTKTTLRKKI